MAGSISPRVRAGDRDIEAIAASLGPWHRRRPYAPCRELCSQRRIVHRRLSQHGRRAAGSDRR